MGSLLWEIIFSQGASGMESSTTIEVRPLLACYVQEAVRLHLEQLSDEFITRFGRRFLTIYYQAFAQSPDGVALVAVDISTERVVGALLGNVGASRHYHYMVKHFGLQLGLALIRQALFSPRLAKDLLRTRARRYIRGVARLITRKFRRSPSCSSQAEAVADLTHLVVDTTLRSHGVGSRLVTAYENLAWQAGAVRIDLVTLPRHLGGAGTFYERLGFSNAGKQVSRSGETFLLYRKFRVKQERQAAIESLQ